MAVVAGSSVMEQGRMVLDWWVGELRAMVPSRVLEVFHPPRDRLRVRFGTGAVTLEHVRGQEAGHLGRIDLDAMPAHVQAELVRRALAGVDLATVETELLLPASQALQMSPEFPAAAEPDLRQVLAFEMDQLTPFAADDVYFDHRVARRSKETKRIRVDLLVMPREDVDRAVDCARAWGLAVRRVGVDGTGDGHAWNLLRGKINRPRRRLKSLMTATLAVTAAVLLVALIVVPLRQKAARLEALETEIADVRRLAEAGASLRDEIERIREQQRFLLERKRSQPTFVSVLDEVTRVMPDDTWLFRFQFRDGEVQVFGNSAVASNLIGQIGQSPIFENPSFRAPVTRDRRADAERFHLTFNVVQPAATP